MKFRLFGITDVGRVRDHNEDNFAVCKDLSEGQWNFERGEVRDLSKKGTVMVVADGMGGTNAGEIASDLAQKSVKEQFDKLEKIPSEDEEIITLLNSFILQAHDEIVDYQQSNLDTAGMGTTLVIVWILNNKLYTSWSGDSRCYVFNPDTPLYPFTDDHSHVWEMVKNDQLSPEEARVHPESNLITQNLGDPNQTPEPEGKVIDLQAGDRVLVCSDGLNGMISDAAIHYILLEERETSEACKRLVEEAKNAGGHDNITVLLMDVNPGQTPSASSVPREASSYQTTEKPGNSLKTYLGAGLLLLVLLTGYHFIFQSGRSAPDLITLNTRTLSLTESSITKLNPGDTFLPYGPEITGIEVTENPENGSVKIAGNSISYTMKKNMPPYTDRLSLTLNTPGNIDFEVFYILKWVPSEIPSNDSEQASPDTAAAEDTIVSPEQTEESESAEETQNSTRGIQSDSTGEKAPQDTAGVRANKQSNDNNRRE